MKKLILGFSLVLASTFIATNALAAEKKTTKVVTTTSYSSSSSIRWGLGFTTWGSPTATFAGSGPAISVMAEFNEMTTLQPFFAFGSSSPFTFAFGAVLRHTLHGGSDNGFHGGLGFNLGTVGTFFVNVFPVAGYHFSLGGHVSNLKLSFDMGPIFEITPTFQFRAIPISATGGASLHYMF